MQNLDHAGKASVEKLRALKAGSEFDRDYIRYEIEGHRKLLDIQEVYLSYFGTIAKNGDGLVFAFCWCINK
jgi:predicted outer membrane protein